MQETLAKTSSEAQRAARAQAYATPLDQFHVGNPELFRTDTLWPYFERLRFQQLVHCGQLDQRHAGRHGRTGGR